MALSVVVARRWKNSCFDGCVAGEVRRCGEDGGAGFLLFPASFSGGRRGWRRRLPWRMEGEEKIRVRVLGNEDDDVAESDWLIW